MNLNNRQGIALAFSLYIVIILLALSSLFVLRTVHEANMARVERELAKSFYIAEGGANDALDVLYGLINEDLLMTIAGTNPQTVSKKAEDYVDSGDGIGFLIEFAQKGGEEVFVREGEKAIYSIAPTALGQGSYQCDIIITEKSDPITVGSDKWDFLYFYKAQSKGSVNGLDRDVIISGDFTVRVQKDNFAKYALFTNHQNMKDGISKVWFTDKTNFSGPIHTNAQFSFAGNPGGTFDGLVTQHNSKAQFYNNGNSIQLDADSNPPNDVPLLGGGYTRGVDEINLESSIQQKDLLDQATGKENINGDGIFLPNKNSALTGGIFVKGNPKIEMSVDAQERAVYTIQEAGVTKVISVDKVNNQTTLSESGEPDITYSGVPDGDDDIGTIIYVEGIITGLEGTVQKDTEVTVSSDKGVVINDHIRYEDYNAGSGIVGEPGYVPPNADGKTNLLGILAWDGDVSIGTSAPNDVDIHGIVLARNGVFQVDNYDSLGDRGTATLLGGAITHFYGVFNAAETGININDDSGYGRNFIYDSRTLFGKSPPYFPTLKTYTSFSNDITDKIVWQEE